MAELRIFFSDLANEVVVRLLYREKKFLEF
jgi:hypothetical protein